MGNILRVIVISCFMALLSAPAFSQQPVALPPQPADSGPSLEATMKFIQENAAEGKLSYTVFVSDTSQQGVEWKNQFNLELTNLVADARTCNVSFHWRSEVNGKVSDDTNYSLILKDVRSIVVLPQEQNQHQVDTRVGHPEWTSPIEPGLFTLVTRRPKGLENAFLFPDEEMANRVAKALVHAVDLCGGGRDPF